ncbi:13158_t:CDS:2, partial [Racocetra fulgida]
MVIFCQTSRALDGHVPERDYTDSRAIKKVKKESEKSDTILKELNARVTKNITEESNTNLKILEVLTVAELLLQENQIPELPELCLVIDNNKPRGDGRFGFVDLILGGLNPSVIELKYINLSGLVKATNNDWNSYSSTNDLASLDKYIENEDEETLLKRKYMFWSKKDNKPNLTTLNDILFSADDQLKKYMNVHGPAQNGKQGIIDSRILIKQHPKDCGILN